MRIHFSGIMPFNQSETRAWAQNTQPLPGIRPDSVHFKGNPTEESRIQEVRQKLNISEGEAMVLLTVFRHNYGGALRTLNGLEGLKAMADLLALDKYEKRSHMVKWLFSEPTGVSFQDLVKKLVKQRMTPPVESGLYTLIEDLQSLNVLEHVTRLNAPTPSSVTFSEFGMKLVKSGLLEQDYTETPDNLVLTERTTD